MNNYLIPANTKKSMLILGLFQKIDLIIFSIGIGISVILLLTLPIENFVFAIIALLPGMITGFLVVPVPNYINVRNLLTSAIRFYTGQRKYKWKGWVYKDGKY